jgi:hypothetical protein
MSHEISQLDISGIQLRDSKTQPKVSLSREIGEAQIVHNIFGKAKVRIIRKYDALWRSVWLVFAFVVAATSTNLLQSWYTARQADSIQGAVPAQVHTDVHDTLPQITLENVVPPSAPAAAIVEPAKPVPAETAKTAVNQKSVQQPQAAMKTPEKEVAKPDVVPTKVVTASPKLAAVTPVANQPATEGKPQLPAIATGSTTAKPQAITPPVAKPIPPKQPAAPVVTTPSTAKIVTPASSPAAAPVQGLPVKEDASIAPVVGKPLSSPVESGN